MDYYRSGFYFHSPFLHRIRNFLMVQFFSQNLGLTKDFSCKHLAHAFNLPSELSTGICALDNMWLKDFSCSFLSPPENTFIKNGSRRYVRSPNKNTGTRSLPSTNIFSQGDIILFRSIPLIEELRNIGVSLTLPGHFITT